MSITTIVKGGLGGIPSFLLTQGFGGFAGFADSIVVDAPIADARLLVGETIDIHISVTPGVSGLFDVVLSLDGGATFPITLLSNTAEIDLSWTLLSSHITATAVLRVSDSADAMIVDDSDEFVIATTTPGAGGDAGDYTTVLSFGWAATSIYSEIEPVSKRVRVKHVDDDVNVFMDFIKDLQYTQKTIASVTVECPDDAALVIESAAVVSANVSVPYPDPEERSVAGTLYANKAVSVTVSGGTVLDPDADPIKLWFHATLSSGEVISEVGKLRIIDN